MNEKRRDALRIATVLGLAITAGILKPTDVLAADWKSSGFDAKSLQMSLIHI